MSCDHMNHRIFSEVPCRARSRLVLILLVLAGCGGGAGVTPSPNGAICGQAVDDRKPRKHTLRPSIEPRTDFPAIAELPAELQTSRMQALERYSAKDISGALDIMSAALEHGRRKLSDTDPRLARLYADVGTLSHINGQIEPAIEAFEAGYAIAEGTLDPSHPFRCELALGLGDALAAAPRPDAARIVHMTRNLYPGDTPCIDYFSLESFSGGASSETRVWGPAAAAAAFAEGSVGEEYSWNIEGGLVNALAILNHRFPAGDDPRILAYESQLAAALRDSGHSDIARERLAAALRRPRTAGDAVAHTDALTQLALLTNDRADIEAAIAAEQEAIVQAEAQPPGASKEPLELALTKSAALHSLLHRYDDARRLYQRARAMHTGYEWAQEAYLIDLGRLERYAGRLDESVRLFESMLGLQKGIARLTASTQRELLYTRIAAGDLATAQHELSVYLDAQVRGIQRDLRAHPYGGPQNEREIHETLQRSAEDVDLTVSLHLQHMPVEPKLAEIALTTVMRRKGLMLEDVQELVASNRRSGNPFDRASMRPWAQRRAELSTLTLTRTRPTQWRNSPISHSLSALYKEESALRTRLFGVAETADASLTVSKVAAGIPEGAAYAEFVKWRPFAPKATAPHEMWGSPRYAVYVLKRSGEVIGRDLGPAEAIDRDVRELRRIISDPACVDAPALASELYRSLLAAIEADIRGAELLLVNPDGELHTVPLAVLRDGDGRLVLESRTLAYITSARQILPVAASTAKTGAPVIMAAPAFGGDSANRPSTGILQTYEPFEALEHALAEGEQLKELMPAATLHTGTAANEARLKEVVRPQVLHIASHGFVLDDDAPGVRGEPGRALRRRRAADDWSQETQAVLEQLPLLRSAVVLANANTYGEEESGEDGILTALEASSLDLEGTELVVVSACESGLGDVRAGHGVFGLQRALATAGSQSQLLSLWRVKDSSTRELMIRYYRHLLAGAGRAHALRLAQLEQIQSGDSHPARWAAFEAFGRWEPLARAPSPAPSPALSAGQSRPEAGPTLHVDWSAQLDAGVVSAPMVRGDVVLGKTWNGLYAVDARSGDVRWKMLGMNDVLLRSDNVLVTQGDNIAPLSETGVPLQVFKYDRRGPMRLLAADLGRVFLAANDRLAALDLGRGVESWSSPLSGPLGSSAETADVLFVFALTGQGSAITAIHKHSLKELWHRETDPFCVLRLATGSSLWESCGWIVRARDPLDGKDMAQLEISGASEAGPDIPEHTEDDDAAELGGIVYMTVQQKLVAIDDATRSLLWTYDEGAGDLVVAGDLLLVSRWDGIRVLDPASGQQWMLKLYGTPSSRVTKSNYGYYVGTFQGLTKFQLVWP